MRGRKRKGDPYFMEFFEKVKDTLGVGNKGDLEGETSEALREDFEKRSLEFRLNCDDGNGDASACHSLGEWLSVMERNYEEAGAVYGKNCDKNEYGPSCFNRGRLHFAGKGVEQDDTVAAGFVNRACKTGHIAACSQMSMLYFQGIGVPKDSDKGVTVLAKSCAMGAMESCNNLGNIHLVHHKKHGMPRDPVKAHELFERACSRSWAPACHTLAVMYKKGDGVPQSDEQYERYAKITEQLVEQTGKIGERTTKAG